MTPPETRDSGDGGSSRRRLDSMIAGRRPASSSGSGAGSRSRSRSRSEESEERPARSRRSAPKDDAEQDDRPRVRRARRSTSEPQDEETSEASTSTEAETESPEDVTEVVERPARRTRRKTSSDDGDLDSLREAVARQETLLAELREGMDQLGTRIVNSGYRPRVAVFVDVPNLIYGYEGDGSLNMGKLLELITEGRDLVRATAYSPVSDDPREPVEQQRFVAPFVPHEYRIVTKPLKRFSDGSIKGNFDVEMAVDMVMMADRVDVICIVSGDADFARAVEVVQQKGVRVEVVAFAGSTSIEMRALADHYFELDRVVKQIL